MVNRKRLKRLLKLLILNTASHSYIFREYTGIGYFGLEKLDQKLIKFLPKRRGFYIELGANDGIKQSNTFSLEKYLGWSGILIEPHPETFRALVKNRSKENHFFNCACVSLNSTSLNLEMRYSDLMTVQLSDELDISDPLGHAEDGAQFLNGEVPYTFEIRARTLNDLLEEANPPEPIDLLSLDVEGAEFQVLSGIDLAKWNISTICVESREVERIEKLLTKFNYARVAKLSHHDYVFQKNQNLPPAF
jgi:FkbM family methyltransferase